MSKMRRLLSHLIATINSSPDFTVASSSLLLVYPVWSVLFFARWAQTILLVTGQREMIKEAIFGFMPDSVLVSQFYRVCLYTLGRSAFNCSVGQLQRSCMKP
jgi:hypothetical protein